MQIQRILLALLLTSICQFATASTHFYASIAGGLSYPNHKNGPLINSTGGKATLLDFTFGNKTGVYAIEAGVNFRYGQLGITYSQRLNTQGNGVYKTSTNLLYPYVQNINSQRLFFTQRLFIASFYSQHWRITPFAQFGEGIARNDTSNIFLPTVPAGAGDIVSGTSHYAFAFQVGGGMLVKISNCLQLFAEYLFTNSGDVRAGNKVTDTSNSALNLTLQSAPDYGNLLTKSALIGIVYNF